MTGEHVGVVYCGGANGVGTSAQRNILDEHMVKGHLVHKDMVKR